MTIVKELDALHVNGEEYKFPANEGDMKYSDFSLVTKSGATITLDLFSEIEPSANFTVNAPSTIKEGQMYILRVTTGATPYTMTLGTGITNPYSESTTLTANTVHQFGFLAIDGDLELQPTADVSPYTAGTGINITNKQISIDDTVVATQTDLAGINQVPSGGTTGQVLKKTSNGYGWGTDNDTTYTAGTGLTLSGTEFSADTTVLATKTDLANIGSYEVVATLPSAETADTKKIYLLGPIGTGADKYEEWIVVDNAGWECEGQLNEIPLVLGNSNTTAYVEVGDPVLSELTATRGHTIYIGINYTTSASSYNNTRFNFGPHSYYYGINYNDVPHIQTQSMGQYVGFSGGKNGNMRIGTSNSNNQLVDYSMVWSFSQITYRTKAWTKIGETSIDLSGYATTSAMNTALATKANVSDVNTKTFEVEELTVSELQPVMDFYANGGYPIIYYSDSGTEYPRRRGYYTLAYPPSSSTALFRGEMGNANTYSTPGTGQSTSTSCISISLSNGTVTSASFQNSNFINYLSTSQTNDQYTPTNNYDPATKKYVDDIKPTSGSTAPSTTPSYVGQQYVDTTNDKLYVATGTTSSSDWTEVGSGGGGGNVIAMTQSEYNALSTAEKNDGKLRIITDAPTEDISVDWDNVANKKVDLSTQTGNLSELKFWIGTTATYQKLDSYDNNTVYICKKVIS